MVIEVQQIADADFVISREINAVRKFVRLRYIMALNRPILGRLVFSMCNAIIAIVWRIGMGNLTGWEVVVMYAWYGRQDHPSDGVVD